MPPVTRRSILTLYGDRPPEVGLPTMNSRSSESGLVIRGFAERVGDPVPLVAVDGSSHLADRLLVDALGAMADAVGGASDVAIAVPAYWGPTTVQVLSRALVRGRRLAPSGVPPRLVSDAVGALIALQAQPGLPRDGVIALIDLGGSGTSITLADAARDFQPIAQTVRYPDFSGDQIDQAMLSDVITEVTNSGGADCAATAAVGSLTRLRDECRLAKERLSVQTTTAVGVELPGVSSEVRFSRGRLDKLIEGPLTALVMTVEDLLRRTGLSWASVSAVAAVGGSASIPLVAQRLSECKGTRVVTTSRPALDSAFGAVLIATPGPDTEVAISTALADATTTGVSGVRNTGAHDRVVAWSDDDFRVEEPTPYVEANPYINDGTGARPHAQYTPSPGPISTTVRARRRLPELAVGAAALVALVAGGGVVYTLATAGTSTTMTPGVTTSPGAATSSQPPIPTPSSTATAVVPPPVSAPPPPAATYEPAPLETVTLTATPTTTAPTTTTSPTTTSSTPPTTTSTPTTTTTTPTTTSPAATTTTTTPTTAPAMTTTYLTIPFVPVPIPIPVPQNPFQVPKPMP